MINQSYGFVPDSILETGNSAWVNYVGIYAPDWTSQKSTDFSSQQKTVHASAFTGECALPGLAVAG